MSENVKPASERPATADEIDLLDVLIVLARQKKWIAGCTIGIGGAALVTSLLMTPIFTSTAKIMPPQQQSSGLAAMMGQLGALAGAAGSIAGLKNPNDLYVGMLQSQTVADNLIQRFRLKDKFEKGTLFETRKQLSAITDITAGKDGLISISVDYKYPKFAADLANAYVDEITQLTQKLAVTDASKRRLFFEQQIKDAKSHLASAEIALKKTQERTGLLQVDSQVQAIIANVAQLKANIAAKEVELASMKAFATEQNPDYQKVQQEIQGLKAQLSKLEQNNAVGADLMVPTAKLPQTGLDYLRSLREVKYQEAVFEILVKQYEIAKLDEARDASVIQVLDQATVPDRKSKPKRALITMAGIAMGFFMGLVIAWFQEINQRAKKNGSITPWQSLRQAWKAGS